MRDLEQSTFLPDFVELDHGSGGLASRDLIEQIVNPALGPARLHSMEDSAILELPTKRLAYTTDSFIVDPVFFYGGDIGKLAVCGTVNDLAVSGAIPLYLSLGLILEEGYPIRDLIRILCSIRDTALTAGVKIACGDTKVLPNGSLDKIAINTSGIGYFRHNAPVLQVKNVQKGDHVIISGYVGDHGLHIMSLREGLGYESRVISDCAPLNRPIQHLLSKYTDKIRCARDVTRGGVATVLHEIELDIEKSLSINVGKIPVRLETQMGADMLGVSPYHLANEGCFIMFVDETIAADAVLQLQTHCEFKYAADIGAVAGEQYGHATSLSLHPGFGPLRGKILPRLC